MRRGVWVVLVLIAASFGAASARADGTTTTGSTSTTPSPTFAPLAASRLTESCVGAGIAAIYQPEQRVLALGTPASSLTGSAYPSDATLVSFASADASGSTCRTAHVALTSVSLVGGAVTASTVEATDGKGSVTGLEIDGSPVDLNSGQTVFFVEDWGLLKLGAEVGRLTSPLVLCLVKRHGSLPAGAMIVVAFSAISVTPAKLVPTGERAGTAQARKQPQATQRKKKHRHHKKGPPQPLKWTPKLGLGPKHYVFPVDGGASYVDTYGGNRSDIYDGWHHGDDLFAPLGTPVVAVARGKLSLIGWNKLGGWRLWLTDKKGNSFYYAHLAGYSRRILQHHHVKAGEVIGFLGRTGDAFTTTPHLHFEIHPHQLVKLKYDGAVDPTRYLRKWKVVQAPRKELPQPARLRAPRGTPAQEAAVVWHQLLVARHLLPATVPTVLRRPLPAAPKPTPQRRLAAEPLAGSAQRANGGPWPALGIAFLGLVAVALAMLAVLRRLRARAQQ